MRNCKICKKELSSWKGKSELCKTCFNKTANRSGENNGRWVGDKVRYIGLHAWMRKLCQKPKWCQDCGKKPPLDLANISQEYKREVSDWEWLCRRCHMIKDGRIKGFIKRRFGGAKILQEIRKSKRLLYLNRKKAMLENS